MADYLNIYNELMDKKVVVLENGITIKYDTVKKNKKAIADFRHSKHAVITFFNKNFETSRDIRKTQSRIRQLMNNYIMYDKFIFKRTKEQREIINNKYHCNTRKES